MATTSPFVCYSGTIKLGTPFAAGDLDVQSFDISFKADGQSWDYMQGVVNWKTANAGKKSWTAKAVCGLHSGKGVALATVLGCTLACEWETTTGKKYTGNMIATGISIKESAEEVATVEFSLTGVGAPTEAA